MKISRILMAAVAVLMMASCGSKAQQDCCGGCKEFPIGLQLYSVRGDMEQDFKGTLQKVKEMGYDGVEWRVDNTGDNSPMMAYFAHLTEEGYSQVAGKAYHKWPWKKTAPAKLGRMAGAADRREL